MQDIQDPVGGGEAQSGNIPRIFIGVRNDANGNGIFSTDEVGAVQFGPGVSRSANDLRTQNNQIKFNADYSIGRHKLKFGYELDNLDVFNLFVQNATGTIYFRDVNAFLAGQANTGTIVPTTFGGTPNPTSQVFNNQTIAFGGNGSFSGDINDAAAQFSRNIHSVYAQDEWEVTDELTLLVGLRYDFYTSQDAPRENPNFLRRYGFDNTQGLGGYDVWLPRLGVTYDVPESFWGQTQLRGGVGAFSGGDPTVWFSNAFSTTGSNFGTGQSNLAPCTAANAQFGATGPITLPTCLVQQQQNAANTFNGPVNVTDPDFQPPSVIRFNAGLTHDTDFGGAAGGFFDDWNVQVDVIHNHFRNSIAFLSLNLQQVGEAVLGYPIYDDVDPLRTGCNATFGGLRSGFQNWTNACLTGGVARSDILLTNGDSGNSTTASIIFRKEFEYDMPWLNLPGSVFVNVGYAFTDSNDSVDGTSATANSNFTVQTGVFYNQLPVTTSLFETRHQVSAAATITQEFIPELPTKFSFVFNARSGRPFTYTFDGSPFSPGATIFGADRVPLYIPTGPDDPNVTFGPAFPVQAFFDFIQEEGLDEFRGQVLPRNHGRSEWFEDLDFRFTQDIPTPIEGHKAEFTVDIENILNLIDDSLNIFAEQADREDIVQIANATNGGRLVYNGFLPQNADVNRGIDASVWRVQVGFKYSF